MSFTNGAYGYVAQSSGTAIPLTVTSTTEYTGYIIGYFSLNNLTQPPNPPVTGVLLNNNSPANNYPYSAITVFEITDPASTSIILYVTTQGGNGGETFPSYGGTTELGGAGSCGFLAITWRTGSGRFFI